MFIDDLLTCTLGGTRPREGSSRPKSESFGLCLGSILRTVQYSTATVRSPVSPRYSTVRTKYVMYLRWYVLTYLYVLYPMVVECFGMHEMANRQFALA